MSTDRPYRLLLYLLRGERTHERTPQPLAITIGERKSIGTKALPTMLPSTIANANTRSEVTLLHLLTLVWLNSSEKNVEAHVLAIGDEVTAQHVTLRPRKTTLIPPIPLEAGANQMHQPKDLRILEAGDSAFLVPRLHSVILASSFSHPRRHRVLPPLHRFPCLFLSLRLSRRAPSPPTFLLLLSAPPITSSLASSYPSSLG
jgi:hypothetical protein